MDVHTLINILIIRNNASIDSLALTIMTVITQLKHAESGRCILKIFKKEHAPVLIC